MNTVTIHTATGGSVTANIEAVPGISTPWALVANPGTDEEYVWTEFATFGEAMRMKESYGFEGDIMKRTPDGSLTTEF